VGSSIAAIERDPEVGRSRPSWRETRRARSGEDSIEYLIGLLCERRASLLHAGVVERDVEAHEALTSLDNRGAKLFRHDQVGLNEECSSTGTLAFIGGGAATLGVAPDQR
jgi:hypothetical protein